MKLKIMALVCALVLILNTGALAFSDIGASSEVSNAVQQLSRMGILSGFEDGTFRPDGVLTRGQFAKIAVYMLGKQDDAVTYAANQVFSDVSASHWAGGFVNCIAAAGIINGYPDGTFGVNDPISYAQALTILVRLLGYSGEDVSYRWPDGYISKASSLGITKNMTFDAYENVTRANAAYIIYNTLLADKKEGSSVKLLSSKSMEDVVIYADWETEASISSGNILTTKGTYKLAENTNVEKGIYGNIGTLYLDAEDRVTAFVPEKEIVKDVTIVSVTQNSGAGKVEITFTEGNSNKTESFGAGAPLYGDGAASTLEKGIAKLETGREARLFYTPGGVFERMYLKESTIQGPVTITYGYSQIYSSFNILSANTLSVVRDGRSTSVDAISSYDIVYYMPGNNTVYAYTDKISGTYESANPIKANVRSVVIAGKEYTLSTQKAINKMNESESAFDLGDRVTLLLGRNGEVVDVVDMSGEDTFNTAVVARSYSEISDEIETKGQRFHYVSLVTADGNETVFEADKDYSDYTGRVVRIEYSGNRVKLGLVANSPISGEFNASVPSLGGHWLAKNCVILELVALKEGESATIKKIEPHNIVTTNLTKNQVIHAEVSGQMRDITLLYVKDVTKSEATFGVVTDSLGKNRYTVLSDNRQTTITTAKSVSKGSAIEIVNSGSSTVVSVLQTVGTGTVIEGYSTGRIRMGGETYVVSDYVQIYGGKEAEEYSSMSLREAMDEKNVDMVTLYSDRSLASGGIIRVIVVKTK